MPDYKDLIELTESCSATWRRTFSATPGSLTAKKVFDSRQAVRKTDHARSGKKYRPETNMADLDNFRLCESDRGENIGIKVEKSCQGLGMYRDRDLEEVAEGHLVSRRPSSRASG